MVQQDMDADHAINVVCGHAGLDSSMGLVYDLSSQATSYPHASNLLGISDWRCTSHWSSLKDWIMH